MYRPHTLVGSGCALVALILAVCGCDSGTEVAFVRFQGGAAWDGGSENDSGTKLILDTATASCAFTFDPISNSNGIEVVANAASCVNANKCIECTVGTSLGDCSINCIGAIPSDAATAADSFNVSVSFTADFTTDMPTPDGMLRFDISSVGFEEFDLTQTPVVDLAGCDGAPDMTVSASNPAGIDAATATSETKGYSIDALGDGTCTVMITYVAEIPLTGADTPGTTVDLARTGIDFTARICDEVSALTCTGPP